MTKILLEDFLWQGQFNREDTISCVHDKLQRTFDIKHTLNIVNKSSCTYSTWID